MNVLDRRILAWGQVEQAHEAQKAGRPQQAIHHYHRSLENYLSAEAYTYLGWAHSVRGDLDEAIATCHRAIAVDPNYGNPYNDIGAYLIEKGRLDEAIPWLEKAIRAKRSDSYCFPWMNLGRIYERKQDWVQAAHCYNQASQCDDTYRPAAKSLSRVLGLLN